MVIIKQKIAKIIWTVVVLTTMHTYMPEYENKKLWLIRWI